MQPFKEFSQMISSVENVVNYRFKNKVILITALTHKSRGKPNYEDLEFLGDSVLDVMVSTLLYKDTKRSGRLADAYNVAVKNTLLADISKKLNLHNFILMSDSEEKTGGRTKVNILADVLEAVIGAIYVDGGFTKAKTFVQRHWKPIIKKLPYDNTDGKSALQAWAQKNRKPFPKYTVRKTGTDHNPTFYATVFVAGYKPAMASGHSKKEAEIQAADAFLRREGLR